MRRNLYEIVMLILAVLMVVAPFLTYEITKRSLDIQLQEPPTHSSGSQPSDAPNGPVTYLKEHSNF